MQSAPLSDIKAGNVKSGAQLTFKVSNRNCLQPMRAQCLYRHFINFNTVSLLLVLCVLYLLRANGSVPLQRFEYAQIHMGVKVRIVMYSEDEPSAETACIAAFKRIAQLEDIFSDYRPRSELMRLCANAGGAPVKVSDELFAVLEYAQRISELTDGAFDVTVGPLSTLWRNARKLGQLPPEQEMQKALRKVGWHKMRLDAISKTVQLLEPGMLLDLGGIAKGYTLDRAIEVLRQHGIHRALIEAGGDIVTGDPPPNEDGWKIELAYARDSGDSLDGDRKCRRIIKIANAAIATSGDTEQFIDIGGVRYSHIVDPRIGIVPAKEIVATVVASEGITADALATVLYMFGDIERFKSVVMRGRFKVINAYLFSVRGVVK
ncbi:MAG: FAD:protein FMN transferase [Armatimonadota bacterium]|nr:FAD:protein FMN transferase [Armatimonadota bacterium]MDW8024520.1 FAD:protein FMN transferase [Armatimonadota bacterium]